MPKILILLLTVCIGCHQQPKTPADKASETSDLIKDKQTSIFFFLNTECPVCQKYSGSFKSMMQLYSPQARLYFVFPGKQSRQAIMDYCAYDSIPVAWIIRDTAYRYSKGLGAEITPQVLIYKNQQLQYSGKIDDRFTSIGSHKTKATVNYIEKALISLRKDEPVEIKKTIPVGCFIEPE